MSGYGEAAAGQSRPRHGDCVVGAGRGGRRELFCAGRLRESSTKKTGPQPAQRPGMDVTNSADGSPVKAGSCQRRSEQSPATRLKPHRNPHRTLALDSDLPSHGSPDREGGVSRFDAPHPAAATLPSLVAARPRQLYGKPRAVVAHLKAPALSRRNPLVGRQAARPSTGSNARRKRIVGAWGAFVHPFAVGFGNLLDVLERRGVGSAFAVGRQQVAQPLPDHQ